MKRSLLLTLLGLSFILASPGRAAEPLPPQVVIKGIEFVRVPEGWFWLSVPSGKPDQDNHMRLAHRDVKVWVDGFYIAKYEILARDFVRFMSEGADSPAVHKDYDVGAVEGCSVRRDESHSYFLVRPEDKLPATHLSWQLADGMARWMGFRLPTEAEWVKAARGTDRRLWPWGDEYPDDTFAGYDSGSPCHPVPVDMFPNGRSPYGAYGMAGNVYEYVADWYNTGYYAALKDGARNPRSDKPLPARSDTTAEISPLKVLKGGRWASPSWGVAILSRTTAEIDYAFRCYGARFAVDEAQVKKLLESGGATVPAQ